MPRTATNPKAAKIPSWQPEDCEGCNHPFTRGNWKSDYSLSGEPVWICPKCSHVNYPPIGRREADFEAGLAARRGRLSHAVGEAEKP